MRRCAEPATHTRALFGGDPAGMHEYRGGSEPTWQAILLRRGVKQVCSGLRYVYLVYRGRQRLSKRTRLASVAPLDSKGTENYVVEIPSCPGAQHKVRPLGSSFVFVFEGRCGQIFTEAQNSSRARALDLCPLQEGERRTHGRAFLAFLFVRPTASVRRSRTLVWHFGTAGCV